MYLDTLLRFPVEEGEDDPKKMLLAIQECIAETTEDIEADEVIESRMETHLRKHNL